MPDGKPLHTFPGIALPNAMPDGKPLHTFAGIALESLERRRHLSERERAEHCLAVAEAKRHRNTLPALDLRRLSQQSQQPGLQRLLAQRIAPQRQQSLQAGLLALLGQPAEIEGWQGVAVPLRFSDGKASFGPIPLGQVPGVF